MDNWYSYTIYAAAPPKPFLPSRSEQFSAEPSLRRGPGSQRSSGSSDTDSRITVSPRTEKSRRFLFAGKRKKHPNLPETSFDTRIDVPGDAAVEVFKAIAYSSCEQSPRTTSKSYNFSRPIDPKNSQLREWEINPRRHSDSSFKSAHTFTQEQFQTPTPLQQQFHSPQSPLKTPFLHTSSEVIANCDGPTPSYNWRGETPISSSFLAEKSFPPLRDRLGLIPRPLSSGSNTLGELEPIRVEKKFPSRFRVNPFHIKHARSKSDQSEAFGSWEEAVDWWYEYGEDETIEHDYYI